MHDQHPFHDLSPPSPNSFQDDWGVDSARYLGHCEVSVWDEDWSSLHSFASNAGAMSFTMDLGRSRRL